MVYSTLWKSCTRVAPLFQYKSFLRLLRIVTKSWTTNLIWFYPDTACRGYPIGMENGKISDDSIVASSWQEPFHAFRPESGRLNSEDGVWCPNTLGGVDKKYYLEIEFPARYNICAVATQGSPLYDTDWVKKYQIEFSMHGQDFTPYTENGTAKV